MNQEQPKTTIRSMERLATVLHLSPEERAFREDGTSLPVAIPRHILALIDPDDPDDPIRKQVVPRSGEQSENVGEAIDPLAEEDHSVTERLIHRYRSRAAFLTTDICPMYCRHCFRRRFTGSFEGPATSTQIAEAAAYIGKHPEITELLLTGGDMMTLSDRAIGTMIAAFRDKRPDLIIRLCTRAPASWPERITDHLIETIKTYDTAPFYLLCQFNHPRELTDAAKRAVARFVDAGIPAMNQTVLLRGVNDDVAVLEELCNALVAVRVKPYYLFQGDLVSGTAHFRVSIQQGRDIEAALRQRLSGLAMPVYAIDLPQGGGKVPLSQDYLLGRNADGGWEFRTPTGERRTYYDPLT